ncbi:MAG: cupin domain-containing protein [Pseudomonadota bacterium]
MTADALISLLDLAPHPEGGWYRQTWIEDPATGRPAGTCIYFLLKDQGASHWHRVDATEIWHFYAGAPLILSLSKDETGPAQDHMLGANLPAERPQIIVPKGHWQAARTTGSYTLVGCTVSPGFHFEGFELAPPGFDIPRTVD